jgi:ABC-type transport system substrate-binding protein
VLTVGVRTLPELMSPALAFTYTERQVLDLIFEPLVEAVTDERAGQYYRPRLAAHMPHVTPLQREFRIRQNARWPDGQPVTAADVRDTVLKLRRADWTGRSGLWSDGLGEPRIAGDPAQVRLVLDHGTFEPLSLMSFPVLPQHFKKQPLRLDDPEFAIAPVGTGPYLAPRRVTEDGRDYLVFGANPHFRNHGQAPKFAEIRLFAVKGGPKEFQSAARPMDVWLDVPTNSLDDVKKAKAQYISLDNSRVYFLAVNHRKAELASADLRRAIAYGIDREKILNSRFRAKRADFHAALNGPYPAGSWAQSLPTRVPASLYNLALAKSKFQGNIELSLKFPNDDPRVAGACTDIQAQLKHLGISVTLDALSPRRLKDAVDKHDYQLAYYHLDYPDETYALWPYFETSDESRALEKGGANFLGYRQDSTLQRKFSDLKGIRQFHLIKQATHVIHAHLYEQMPLIPLWQLHIHVAFRGVIPRALDARHVFASVNEW